jgi:hypothetical protein
MISQKMQYIQYSQKNLHSIRQADAADKSYKSAGKRIFSGRSRLALSSRAMPIAISEWKAVKNLLCHRYPLAASSRNRQLEP